MRTMNADHSLSLRGLFSIGFPLSSAVFRDCGSLYTVFAGTHYITLHSLWPLCSSTCDASGPWSHGWMRWASCSLRASHSQATQDTRWFGVVISGTLLLYAKNLIKFQHLWALLPLYEYDALYVSTKSESIHLASGYHSSSLKKNV